jgi:hypothetical protein
MKHYDKFNKQHVLLTESARKQLPYVTEAGYIIPEASVLVLDKDLDKFLNFCAQNNVEVSRLGCGRDHTKHGDLFIPFLVIDDQKSFNYRLLSRLQHDCDYFLGAGGRQVKHLWAGNVPDQIAKMKELWNGFGKFEKPEWLTMEQIEEYETKMSIEANE